MVLMSTGFADAERGKQATFEEEEDKKQQLAFPFCNKRNTFVKYARDLSIMQYETLLSSDLVSYGSFNGTFNEN